MEMNDLLLHMDLVHTTEMGVDRIRKNLKLTCEDVVAWCKDTIMKSDTVITRQGKNWYAQNGKCVITVNAYSYTIITAHLMR